MRKFIILGSFAFVGMLANAAISQAQSRTQPLNPTAAVVPATDTTAGVVATTIKGIGRVVADTLENNAITRTLNNLLGRTVVTPTQPGFSPLPDPRSFQSTQYPNSFRPATPVVSTFGQSPTIIFPK
jgi:hypothetical protein